MRNIVLALLVGTLVSTAALADTVYMKNGVQIHGKVISQDDKRIVLQIGDRKVTVRTNEAAKIEENEKTGKLDRQVMLERARQREEEMTEITGLTPEQRTRVKAVMQLLLSEDPNVRVDGQRKLVALAQEMDVFTFFAHYLPMMLPRFIPGVLDVMAAIQPENTIPILREQVLNVDAGARAKSLELIARLGDVEGIPLAARGLLDHEPLVQIAAAAALGQLRAKEATPVFIEAMKGFDVRVNNACREALSGMWSTPEQRVDHFNAGDWQAFWETRANSVASPLQPFLLEPLVPAGSCFVDE
ncbi:MAG TPA: hypothetical protein PLO37_19980 [Candidatus Hydrogenedentes bacterium]|nr:hypothetical protein [Candidatus Hydrogenedentota bacterium]HPG69135.1 hypothetical protein [Candidatus Hydrogenedentota bacterium]